MKIQLLTAATILTLSTSAFSMGGGSGHGPAPQTNVSNNATNSLAIGGETLIGAAAIGAGGAAGALAYNDGGRAVAGSVYLQGSACNCDFGQLTNTSVNAIAVGTATAGSIHVNTTGRH